MFIYKLCLKCLHSALTYGVSRLCYWSIAMSLMCCSTTFTKSFATATRYVNKFMLCFTRYESLKGFEQQKYLQGHWQWCNSIAIYNFLLVLHCYYVSILHRFRNIITCFQKFKGTWHHTSSVFFVNDDENDDKNDENILNYRRRD